MASKDGQANPIVGYRYFMSVHMGLCRGPIDELREIRVGDLVAWSASSTDNTRFDIDQPNLFGGEEKEGGIKGWLQPLMGAPAQVVPDDIKEIMGGLVPDFRGVATLFYNGLIAVNNPYPKAWKMRIRRYYQGWDNDAVWYSEKCAISLTDDLIHAMNPAHIIYECATNRAWGRGLPTSFLDGASFQAAADTLYDEGFGLCLRWNRQDDLDKFVQTVINHIGAVIFIDRSTGLLTLNLLRGDYDPEALPSFDFDSGLLEITEDQSGSSDTSYNEIIVKYHDPITDLDGQVRVQNLASFHALGSNISATVEYIGLPTGDLAARVAQRDLEMQSPDLHRMTLKFDRRAGFIQPGGVFRISAPSRGITSMIMRAGNIEDSPLTDGTITISAVQDVFGLPSSSYAKVQEPAWTPPDRTAHVVDIRRVEEFNYWDLVTTLSPADLATIEPDSGAVKSSAKQPTPLSMDYVICTAAFGEGFVERGVNAWEPVATLAADIGPYDTTITFNTQSNTWLIVPSITALIGDELVSVDIIDINAGTATILRGIIDTIPAAHEAGDLIWFQYAQPSGDGREYTTGETVVVKMLTRTSTQKLAEADAPGDAILIGGRQGRPFPPGNLRLNGVRFGELTFQAGDLIWTWAHRDRIIQNTIILGHLAGSTGPETGTTYTLKIYNGLSLLRTVTGITGDNYNYTISLQAADGNIADLTFELLSVRDGYSSWQTYLVENARVAAIAWTARTSAADNNWNSIAYGNGVFVAVASTGTGNRVMTSPNGITWTSRTSAADNNWMAVAFGGGLFVAVANSGTGNRVMTSPNGITWTARTSAADNDWRGVTYGNGLFVAVGATGTGNRVMTSPDGITWTVRTSAADNDWRSVTYGGPVDIGGVTVPGIFVAVALTGTGNRVMTSISGTVWTIRTSAADNGWRGVAYGNGLFVAVANTGTGNRIMTSADGVTWTSRTSPADNNWTSVVFALGTFVAVSNTGTGNRVMVSSDGITWLTRASAVDNNWTGIAYNSGRFVAVAASGTGNRVMTSE